MNMGIADGVDLGWKIAAVLQGWGGPALLASYAPLQIDAACVPHAAAVASIGIRRAARGETVAAEHAAPLYVRNKVALDVYEQAALRAANAQRVSLAAVKAAA